MKPSPLQLLTAALLGLAAAALLACGSTGKGLIPAAAAGPLQSDFEAVARAAQSGNGDCTATEEAIRKAEQDFATLPASIDRGLRARLRTGIENLSARAQAVCAEPAAPATLTNTVPSTSTNTSTTTSTSSTTSTSTSPSTPTATTPTNAEPSPEGGPEGGTPAPPGDGEGNQHGEGNGR
jgi:hypothetical protein